MSARGWIVLWLCGALNLTQPALARPVTTPSPEWTGTWRLDLARSHFSGQPPRGEVRSIEVSGDKMTVRSVVTPRSGKKMLFYYSVSLDGRFHPLSGNPDGDSIAMRLVDPSKVGIVVQRAGKTSATATTEVSAHRLVMDRKRRALSGSPSGDRMVYDRVH